MGRASGLVERLNVLLILCLSGWHPSVFATHQTSVVVDDVPGVSQLDAEGVVSLVQHTPGVIIVDARVRSDRLVGYIEGSVSLPDTETTCGSLARILPVRTTPVVFYCNGVKCGRSANAAQRARECGYGNVYWFRGGFEEWINKKYPYLKK